MQVAGWKTASMFRRYAITEVGTTVDAMARLQAKREADRAKLTAQGQPEGQPEFMEHLRQSGPEEAQNVPEMPQPAKLRN